MWRETHGYPLCIYFVHDILCTYVVYPLSEDSSVIEEKYDVVVHFRFLLWLLIT